MAINTSVLSNLYLVDRNRNVVKMYKIQTSCINLFMGVFSHSIRVDDMDGGQDWRGY